MKKRDIAVLLTCHNRKAKTIGSLASLFQATIPQEYQLDFYLTDDGSTDGTGDAVEELFPQVRVIRGDGNLFWAGGMSLAWETAMQEKSYDAYLLLNDDVELYPDFFMNLLEAEAYSLKETGKRGIYSGATVDKNGEVTYGGSKVNNYLLIVRLNMLAPTKQPQVCDITNANVLWVSKEVVDKIGIFDYHFTHGIADYDYSFHAKKKKIPLFLAPGICGECTDDHQKNWKSNQYTLKERIAYLKSPKGLAYDEYLYYIGKHFPLFLPYSFMMLWIKTLFPTIWDRTKKNKKIPL
ncbi:MAG: glycosyltransferase family 2 protein [Bacteroidales bacterium]|nr:glycosyltransferase family 2 protein [Bacteroidales bacterium]